jgi:hypothetical protein
VVAVLPEFRNAYDDQSVAKVRSLATPRLRRCV